MLVRQLNVRVAGSPAGRLPTFVGMSRKNLVSIQCGAQVERASSAAPLAIAASLVVASQALFPATSLADMAMASPAEASASYAYTDDEDVRRQVGYIVVSMACNSCSPRISLST